MCNSQKKKKKRSFQVAMVCVYQPTQLGGILDIKKLSHVFSGKLVVIEMLVLGGDKRLYIFSELNNRYRIVIYEKLGCK